MRYGRSELQIMRISNKTALHRAERGTVKELITQVAKLKKKIEILIEEHNNIVKNEERKANKKIASLERKIIILENKLEDNEKVYERKNKVNEIYKRYSMWYNNSTY